MNYTFKTFILFCLLFYSCGSEDGELGTIYEGTGNSGSLAKFTISNNHLYIVKEGSLFTSDITNKTITPTNSEYLGSGVETIFALDSLLLLGTRSGMMIYDIYTDPKKPTLKSFKPHFYSCDPVTAKDTIAYVTLNSAGTSCHFGKNQLEVYSINDIENPHLIERIDMESPKGLATRGDFLLVSDKGIKLYSTAKKDSLLLIDYLEGVNAHDIIPGPSSWVVIGTDGIKQYEIENNKLEYISQVVRYEN